MRKCLINICNIITLLQGGLKLNKDSLYLCSSIVTISQKKKNIKSKLPAIKFLTKTQEGRSPLPEFTAEMLAGAVVITRLYRSQRIQFQDADPQSSWQEVSVPWWQEASVPCSGVSPQGCLSVPKHGSWFPREQVVQEKEPRAALL